MHTPYPDSFPIDSGQIIVNALLNRVTARLPDVCHAGWEVLGYALGQLVGQPLPPVVFGSAEPMGRVELAHALEECQSSAVHAVGAINWLKIVQALLTLLPLLFAEAQGGGG